MRNFFKKSISVIASLVIAGTMAGSLTASADDGLRNGDTNGDGVVDLRDAVNICKHILKNPELEGIDLKQADYNKDGKVDLHDAVFVARRILCDRKLNEVVSLINSKRQEEGVDPINWDMALTDASMKRASELPKKFSGDLRPDNSQFSTILTEYDIAYEICENCVAAVPATAKELFDAMMDEESIKTMLVNADYTKIGVGYCPYSDKYKHYWAILLI